MDKKLRQLNDSMTKIHLLRHWSVQSAVGGNKIHPRQMPILDYIKCNSGCTQAEVSDNMGVTPAAITLATQRLEKEGLIKKITDPENLRRKILKLTEQGEEYWSKTHETFYAMDKKEFDGFSDEELEILQSYFDRIMFNLTGRNIGDMGFREMSKFKNCILDSKGGKGDICSD